MKNYQYLTFSLNLSLLCEDQLYQCVFRPNHLPYKAASTDVILQISTHFHLELCPSLFQCVCAELQKTPFVCYQQSTICYGSNKLLPL